MARAIFDSAMRTHSRILLRLSSEFGRYQSAGRAGRPSEPKEKSLMSVTAPRLAQDLVESAKTVAAIANQHADYGDRNGRLAQPVVDALHYEGLYGMWTPRSVRGGSELDPISSLQVLENVAYGDPSAGWVLMAAALAI